MLPPIPGRYFSPRAFFLTSGYCDGGEKERRQRGWVPNREERSRNLTKKYTYYYFLIHGEIKKDKLTDLEFGHREKGKLLL